jgi:hypothetical protein
MTRLANHVTIQGDASGWYLAFYEAIPPFLAGTPDEIKIQLEEIGPVPAECVARIFLPAARIGEFLAAIKSVAPLAPPFPSQDDSQ